MVGTAGAVRVGNCTRTLWPHGIGNLFFFYYCRFSLHGTRVRFLRGTYPKVHVIWFSWARAQSLVGRVRSCFGIHGLPFFLWLSNWTLGLAKNNGSYFCTNILARVLSTYNLMVDLSSVFIEENIINITSLLPLKKFCIIIVLTQNL